MRKDHPLRAIRAIVDEVLKQLSRRFDAMYAKVGRPSIPPEQLLRAQLLQMLYSIRSERLLMEEIDYSMLFRSFVGLKLDGLVRWDFVQSRDGTFVRKSGGHLIRRATTVEQPPEITVWVAKKYHAAPTPAAKSSSAFA